MSHTELRLPSKCFWGGGPLEGLRQLVELRPTGVRHMDGGIPNPRIRWTVFRWEGAGREGRGRQQREQSGERRSSQGEFWRVGGKGVIKNEARERGNGV